MRDAESVPEHNILVIDIIMTVRGEPGGDADSCVAGGLRDVPAGGVELVVVVWRTSAAAREWSGRARGEGNSVDNGTFPTPRD